MTAQEKAAEVLVTPVAAPKTKRDLILGAQPWTRKEFDTFRVRFARKGYVLQRVIRFDDGRTTYQVRRSGQARIFSHGHDLVAFLSVVEGAPV